MTAPKQPARIRWHEGSGKLSMAIAWSADIGEFPSPSLVIFTPRDPAGDHYLASRLPGQRTRHAYGTPDELKAEAENWLAEFVTSLGAVFPEPAREHKLPLIGHDYALVRKLAEQVNRQGVNGHTATQVRDTRDRRGFAFDVLIHVDRKPTSHVAKVTVVLDRIEEAGQ